MKDTSENTDQIEETEDTSTVPNATTDEGHDDVPARVRLSPIAYEIIRAGSKAYTLLIAYSDANRTPIRFEVGQLSDSKRTVFRLKSDSRPD